MTARGAFLDDTPPYQARTRRGNPPRAVSWTRRAAVGGTRRVPRQPARPASTGVLAAGARPLLPQRRRNRRRTRHEVAGERDRSPARPIVRGYGWALSGG